MLASNIITPVRDLLRDHGSLGSYRWDDAELLRWLDLSIQAIINAIPNAHSELDKSYDLSPGSEQDTPTAAIRLIDVLRNTGGQPITKVLEGILDLEDPGWQSGTANSTVLHWIPNEMDPSFFAVYPPQPATPGSVVIRYSTYPDALASTSSTVGINDRYRPVLIEYVAHYAFGRDANNSADMEKSKSHLENAVGLLQSLISGDAA